jgi:hypothetical protein
MSTRAHIGIVHRDGSVTAIYTHNDGAPDHHGPLLLKEYNTEAKVRKLLKLGSLSVLGAKIGQKHSFSGRRDASAYAFVVARASRPDASDYARERLQEAEIPTAICAQAEAEDWCLAYRRDRGDKPAGSCDRASSAESGDTYDSIKAFEEACQDDYTYLFAADHTWKVRHWDGPWACLSHDECKDSPEMAARCAAG